MSFTKLIDLRPTANFFLSGLAIFIFQITVFAQHCPFDGGHLIAVHLTDAKGKPILTNTKNLTLVEVNNPVAESCDQAEGLLTKKFFPTKQTLQTTFKRFWKDWIEPDYKNWILLKGGYYAIILNQAENDCMIKKEGAFDYRAREFEIRLEGISFPKTIKVKKENIYSLCTNNGSWTRIKPIEIKVK